MTTRVRRPGYLDRYRWDFKVPPFVHEVVKWSLIAVAVMAVFGFVGWALASAG